MANKKMKLTGELSLKDVALDSTQFHIPKKVKIDFSQARPKNKYKDGKATNVLECYVLSGVDERTAKAIDENLIDVEDVKTITIEVYGSFEEIETAIGNAQFAYVELLDTKVKALWVAGNNAGYKAVKLVAQGLKLLN